MNTKKVIAAVAGLAGAYVLTNSLMKDVNTTIRRTYYAGATNGVWYGPTGIICFSIELPDLDNQFRKSCIPGKGAKYELSKKYSADKGWHFSVNDVPGRSGILIHAANYATTELLGCIAPVTKLTSPGIGESSQAALTILRDLYYPVLDAGHKAFLTIY